MTVDQTLWTGDTFPALPPCENKEAQSLLKAKQCIVAGVSTEENGIMVKRGYSRRALIE
jgi:hypothetical protein